MLGGWRCLRACNKVARGFIPDRSRGTRVYVTCASLAICILVCVRTPPSHAFNPVGVPCSCPRRVVVGAVDSTIDRTRNAFAGDIGLDRDNTAARRLVEQYFPGTPLAPGVPAVSGYVVGCT